MTAIFSLPVALQGKKTEPLMVNLCIELRLGLWHNRSRWIDPALDPGLWYHTWYREAVEQNRGVEYEVYAGPRVLTTGTIERLNTTKIRTEFDQEPYGDVNIKIKISRMQNLVVPRHQDLDLTTMLKLQSVQLQGVEVLNMLPNSLYGQDCDIVLPIETPIYPWMIKHHIQILRRGFPTAY